MPQSTSGSDRAGPALQPVPFPDLSRMEPVVQQQLSDARSSLEARLKQPGATNQQLSEHFGSLGNLYHTYVVLEAAAACYRNAHALEPEEFRWPYYLGKVYEEGKLAEAAASLRAALAIRPDDPAAQLSLAEVLLDQNDRQSARAPLFQSAGSGQQLGSSSGWTGKMRRGSGRFLESGRVLSSSTENSARRLEPALPVGDGLSETG